jgi:hypothetical protein
MFALTIGGDGLVGFGLLFLIGTIIVSILCILIMPAFIVIALTQKRAETFKRNRENTIIAQYDPPNGLSPAEVGYLYDMDCGKKEIIATLLDLKRRQIVMIIDDKKITVTDDNAYANLYDYEKIAIDIYSSGVDDSEIINNKSKSLLNNDFARSVKSAVSKKGFTVKSHFVEISKRALLFAVVICFWPLIISLINGINFNDNSYQPWTFGAFVSGIIMTLMAVMFLFPFYIGAGFIMMKLWVKVVGKYWLGSKSVRLFWPELEGYRLFIKQTDLRKIQYEAQQQDESTIGITLPYAIVFKLDTKYKI